MKEAHEVLIRPILTEKSNRLIEDYRKYSFEVANNSNKQEIKNAIETFFNVKVESVRIINVKPRKKRTLGKIRRFGYTKEYKKAIVQLKEGFEINLAGL
ncbi:MAG: 50S ribosomal protein L23 [Aquificaceae bacterium]|nr:50S ribosomal protein L23 [Aquificaceae bacterium]